MKSPTITKISPFGAVSKLAKFYGFESANKLMLSLDMKPPGSWNRYDIALLEKICAIDIIKDDIDTHKLFHRNNIEDICLNRRLSKPLRACPECSNDGIFHKLEWQNIWNVCCDVHQVRLCDWNGRLFSTHISNQITDANLPDPSISTTSLKPNYWSHLCALSAKYERGDFLHNIFSIADKLIRPLDFISTSLKWPELPCYKVEEILEDAYRIGGHPDVVNIWNEMIREHRKVLNTFNLDAPEYGLPELNGILNNVDWKNKSITTKEVQSIIFKYHSRLEVQYVSASKRLRMTKTPDDASFQVDGRIIASLMGIHYKAITEMVENNTLPYLHGGRQPDKQAFDIHQVITAILAAFNQSVNTEFNSTRLVDIPNGIYKAFNISKEELISAIFTGKIKAFLSLNSTLNYISCISVDIDSLGSFLEKWWLKLSDQSVEGTAKVLGVNRTGIESLLNKGFIEYRECLIYGSKKISADSIRKFVNQYYLVNRQAMLTNEPPYPIINEILNNKLIKPVLHEKIATRRGFMTVVKKSLNDANEKRWMTSNPIFKKSALIDLSKNVAIYTNSQTNQKIQLQNAA